MNASPNLRDMLATCCGQVIVQPTNKERVIRVAAPSEVNQDDRIARLSQTDGLSCQPGGELSFARCGAPSRWCASRRS